MKNVKLQAAREKAGLTQKQVAQIARMPEQTYQRYEYDVQEPGVQTAIRIAKALNSTVEALFSPAPISYDHDSTMTIGAQARPAP